MALGPSADIQETGEAAPGLGRGTRGEKTKTNAQTGLLRCGDGEGRTEALPRSGGGLEHLEKASLACVRPQAR